MPIHRSDMGRLQLTVSGADMGDWDYFEGGDITPESQQYSPGGMAPNVAVGGRRVRSEITLRRAWSDNLISKFITLDNGAGIATATVTYTPLKNNRKPSSAPIVYTGVLGTVTRPGYDSNSSTVVYLQLTISANEAIHGP